MSLGAQPCQCRRVVIAQVGDNVSHAGAQSCGQSLSCATRFASPLTGTCVCAGPRGPSHRGSAAAPSPSPPRPQPASLARRPPRGDAYLTTCAGPMAAAAPPLPPLPQTSPHRHCHVCGAWRGSWPPPAPSLRRGCPAPVGETPLTALATEVAVPAGVVAVTAVAATTVTAAVAAAVGGAPRPRSRAHPDGSRPSVPRWPAGVPVVVVQPQPLALVSVTAAVEAVVAM